MKTAYDAVLKGSCSAPLMSRQGEEAGHANNASSFMNQIHARIAILCLVMIIFGAALTAADDLAPKAHAVVSAPVEAAVAGNFSDSEHLLLGRASSAAVFEADGSVYAAVTSFGEDGLQLVSITDPASPRAAGSLEDDGSGGTLLLDGAYDAEIFETGGFRYAAVASSIDDGFQIVNITDPANPTAAGQVADTEGHDELLLDGASSVDIFETGGSVYAAVASADDDGLQLVNITNPADPAAVGNLQDNTLRELDGAISVDTFKIGSNTYAIVASVHDNGLQIIDISDPVNPSAATRLQDSSTLLLEGAQDLDVFRIGSSVYAAVASNGAKDDGLQLIDITNPASPASLGQLKDDDFLLLGGAGSVDVFETGGGAYAAVAALDDSGIQLVDVTSPANPVPVGQLKSGEAQLFGDFGSVTVFEADGGIYAGAAGSRENGLQLVYLRTSVLFENPVPVGNLQDDDSLELDGARGVDVFTIGSSTYAAVASYHDSGLQIVNITSPVSPAAVGELEDTASLNLDGAIDVDAFRIGSKTYAAVAAYQDNGLQIVNVTDPANPAPVGKLQNSASRELDGATAVDTFKIGSKTYAAVAASRDGGLQIVDITAPASPAAVGRLQHGGGALLELAADVDTFKIGSKTYAAVTSTLNDSVQIIDISDPANPNAAGSLSDSDSLLLDGAFGVSSFTIGSAAYAAATSIFDSGLQIIDVANPASPRSAGSLEDGGSKLLYGPYMLDAFRAGGFTYAAIAAYFDNGLQIVNLTNPASPLDAGNLADGGALLLGGARDVAVFTQGPDTYAVVSADIDDGLQIVKLASADIIKPAFDSASLDENAGVLTITFDESIDITHVNLARMHVSDAGDENTVPMDGAAFDNAAPDSNTVSMTLNQTQLNLITAMDSPQLDIEQGAVRDLFGNAIDAAPDSPIAIIRDITKPSLAFTALDYDTSEMTITFDAIINVTAVDLTKMRVSDAGQTKDVVLDGASFNRAAPDSYTISLILNQTQLDMITVMDSPQLDIEQGAVRDLFGNAIDAAPGGHILIFIMGTDTVLWNATITAGYHTGSLAIGWDNGTMRKFGSIAYNAPTMNNMLSLNGITYAVQSLDYSIASVPSDTTLSLDSHIPESERGFVHLAVGNVRCSFLNAAAEGSGMNSFYNWADPPLPNQFSNVANATAVILYNQNYLALNGNDTVILAQGAQYADAGASTPDSATVAGNATDLDTSLGGTHRIHYEASRGCGVLDTAVRTVEVRDAAKPSFVYASLNENTGVMTIAFDETIDISDTDLTMLRISDAGANAVSLEGAAFDSAAPDSDAISMTLSAAQMDQIVEMSAPQLDIGAGAVSDYIGHAIDAADGNSIAVTLGVAKQTLLGNPVSAGRLPDSSSLHLGDASGVDTFQIGSKTYAAVTAFTEGGLQIINVTDPASPSPVASLPDSSGLLLNGAENVDTFVIGKNTYAAIASRYGSGLQIVNVTNPASPAAAGNLPDTNSTLLASARNVDTFVIGQNTYAAVLSLTEGGIQIVNITNPASPAAAGNLYNAGSIPLNLTQSLKIFAIGQSTYAAVPALSEDYVFQIVNVTDPASPAAAGNLPDDISSLLESVNDVDIFMIGSNAYAAAASQLEDGLQIVNITNPASPTAAGNLKDSGSLNLERVRAVDTFAAGQSTFAAMLSYTEGGIQIVNITDPASPTAAGNLDDTDSTLLDGARDVDTFVIGQSTYAAVVSDAEDGLQIVKLATVDREPPAFALAELDKNAGEMTIAFSETIDISDTDLNKLHVGDGQASNVTLQGAVFNYSAADSDAIFVTLSQEQLDLVIPISAPQLDIGAGAVSDLAGNVIDAAPGNPVTVTREPNIPPAAPDTQANTAEDAPVIIIPAIFDADGTPEISAIGSPANGTAVFNSTAITYTPAQDFSGTDSFGYTVTDGQDTAQGAINITVTQNNNDPVLGTIGNQTAQPGVQLTIIPAVTDADLTDEHSYSIARGTLPASAVFASSDGTLVWTPAQDDIGSTHTVTITVHDGRGGSDSVAFNITVADQDLTPPVITVTGDDPLLHERGEPYEDPGAVADDDSPVFADLSQLNVNVPGDYIVTYTATDSNNNTGTASRTVRVQDTSLTGSLHVDPVPAGDAQPATQPRPSRGGGGGGGGGGATPTASDESVRLYSAMWNCNEQTTTIILDSSAAAEITLIANSESFTPAAGPVQNLDGRTAYTANAHASIMLLKVTVAGGLSVTKTINTLDACTGQIEYAAYVPDAPAPIAPPPAPEPQAPKERSIVPAPVPVQEQDDAQEPGIAQAPDAEEPDAAHEPDVIEEPDCGPGTILSDGECVQRTPAPSADDSGCLIATAAYGTELAPQVQMLRELRDDTLLSTDSGASFMSGFNSLYYAFSPEIADMQRNNPAFRDAARTLIAPMIHSLSVMSLADENSEASVLALGSFVIVLNLGMYLAAPAAAAIAILRQLRMNRA